MKVKKFDIFIITAGLLVFVQIAQAQSARELLRQGNALYADANYSGAINKYDQAIADLPGALEPQFNKANGFYRMDDMAKAIELYNAVAAESKDMKLIDSARYNNGNCFFQKGLKNRNSKPQDAIDDMKTAISYWRKVLDVEPGNENAARNIEVARQTIKEILDQPKDPNQQQDPNQSSDPNQSQDPNQDQDPNQQQQSDPNQPQDPNQQQQQQQQQQDPNQAQDPNQQQQQEQQKQEEKEPESDATAQEILDREQQQKKERQMLQMSGYREVEKDW